MKCREELGSNYQNQNIDSRRILETMHVADPKTRGAGNSLESPSGLYGTQSDFKVEIFCEQTSQIVTQDSSLPT